MKIELMCRSTARLVITMSRGDRSVAPALGDQGQDLLLAWSERVEMRVGTFAPRGQEQLDDSRVDDGAP